MKSVHKPCLTANLSEEPHIDRSSHIVNSCCGSRTSIGPHNKIIESQGVHIGTGAVVGSGFVVTKDVEQFVKKYYK
jgi:acetyltransferase-like isoleucine patch superfamily enzyme